MKRYGVLSSIGGVVALIFQVIAWIALLSPMYVIFHKYNIGFFWSLLIFFVLEFLSVIPFVQPLVQLVFWIWSAVLVSNDMSLASPFYWVGVILVAVYFIRFMLIIISGIVSRRS